MSLRTLACLSLTMLLRAFSPESQALNPGPQALPADATRTASGLAYRVVHPGQGGAHPTATDFVRVHFMGWDGEGKPFANTRADGEGPCVNLERIMPGMRESLLSMTAGERRRLWIPEALAFAGAKGRPAGTVSMDLELLEILPPPSQAPTDVAAPGPDAQVLRSGLAFKVLRPGRGQVHPNRASWVSVHYTGWTTDGKLFDTSITRGAAPSLRLKDTIEGWIEGLQLMTVGERRRFWVPQKLAYRGQAGMPAGVLVFDVELVGFHD
jgi:peptidylprolyl isomerase